MVLTMGEYFPVVDRRPSPASRGEARRDRIVSIEFAGPVTAFARVECAIGPKFFTDLLTLIRVDGRPMIEHVVRLFPAATDFVFICARDHLETTPLRSVLQRLAPTAPVVAIEPHKKGPVWAALQAERFIADDRPVLLHYCDFAVAWDYDHFRRTMRELDPAGCVRHQCAPDGRCRLGVRDEERDGHGDVACVDERRCAEEDDERCDDCDDAEPTVFAANPEVCDGLDNDCNDEIDDGAPAPAAPSPVLGPLVSPVSLAWADHATGIALAAVGESTGASFDSLDLAAIETAMVLTLDTLGVGEEGADIVPDRSFESVRVDHVAAALAMRAIATTAT